MSHAEKARDRKHSRKILRTGRWLLHQIPRVHSAICSRINEDVAAAVADSGRVAFYANYTSEMQRAINEDGVDVRGYFAWSLFDNFEWSCVAPSNGPAHALGSHTSLSAGSAATRSASA